MNIIDKRGKIFGLINVVDFLILAIAIIFIAGGISKFGKLSRISTEGSQEIQVSIKVEGVSDGLVEAIQKDDLLKDSVRGTNFGKVLDKTASTHKEMVIGKDGKVEFMEIPDLYDVDINISSVGSFTEEGVLISNNSVYIGTEIRLKSSLYVFDSIVTNITK